MIDIHTHILPGIDDGSRDLYETLEMVQISAENGVTDIVATPHCNIPGRYRNYVDADFQDLFMKTAAAIEDEGIPIRICPGMEVYMTDEVPSLLEDGKIMPLNGSHYVLVEFAFDSDPEYANLMLHKMRELGAIPVIAHVERYYFLQDNPALALQWRRSGYVIQCNKGSFQGRFGKRERQTAYQLLDRHLVDVIASDTHRPFWRTPNMAEVYEMLQAEYSERYMDLLFRINPRRICGDRPIVIPKAETFR